MRYAPYSHAGTLGYAPSNFQIPAAWYRPARDFAVEFRQARGRAPNASEEKIISDQVNELRGGMARSEELTFEHHHRVLEFFLQNGRMPSGYPARTGENNQLVNAALAAVNTHKAAYGAAHPDLLHQIANAASAVVHTVEKIPVVGDAVKITGEVYSAPFKVAVAIGSGERIDHVALGALKDQLKIAKDAAPYAQMVVSLVPGVGTGVAAAMGAGVALAEGQSITAALKAGIRGALPGGPLVQAGFDMALKVAAGENVGQAALEGARSQLPPTAQKAFDIGLAVATGEKLQTALAKGLASFAPGQLQTILAAGEKALASTPGLADALKSVAPGAATEGFHLAAGLLSHAGINEKALIAARAQLPPDVVAGFDAALKTQMSHITWLKNVVSAPAPTASGAAYTAAVTPVRAQLRTLDPPKKPAAAPAQEAPRALDPPKKEPIAAPLRALDPPKHPAAPTPATIAPMTPAAYAPYPQIGALNDPPPTSEVQSPTHTATEVRSPTSTSTEVRSPTSTSTEVRSPTSTSTEAYTQGNMTVTVTGGAGAGATSVEIHAPPLNRQNTAHSKGAPKTAQENTNINAPRPKNPTAQENTSVNAPRPSGPTAQGNASVNAPTSNGVGWALGSEEAWGPAITNMPRHMEWAGRSAVNGSKGQPRKVLGPDGTTYLFALEGGTLTARPAIRL
jgi:hypothetical protein